LSPSKRIFTIHLVEDELGYVRVISDWSGHGDHVLALGIEILDSLADIQPYTEGMLGFAPAIRTNAQH